MKPLKISLLIFIFTIINFAQQIKIEYNAMCNSRVLFVDSYETTVEIKCYEEESDTGINFILLSQIRNFSNWDLILDPTESEIFSREVEFKPFGYQIIENINSPIPNTHNLQTLGEIEIKSKSSISILYLFSQWKENDKYETILNNVDADIIVGTAKSKGNNYEQIVFNMIFFKKVD
jgi:hypothetical protein